MVGRGRPRKRAPSVSTVATIDDSSIRCLRESVVLKPVSPRAHADDWPCFLLSDATVYHRNGSMANLLHVDLEGPFIIESSTSFSIGQKDDNGLPLPVLWASGQSGWFEIDPSDKYKPISDVMFQGVNLHYSILTKYEDALERLHNKSKKHRSKTLRHIQIAVEDLLFHVSDRAARIQKRSPAVVIPGKGDVEMVDASGGVASRPRVDSEQHGLPVLLDALSSIRESILEQVQQGKAKKHPDQMTPNTIHFKIYLACSIKHRFGSAEICEYFVRDLWRLLRPEWQQSEFYKWVQANVNSKPRFEYSTEAECLGLTRRKQKQPKAATQETGQPSHSAKQPAPEPAGKQPPKKRGRPSGKAAGLRPSLGGKKRPRTDEGYELGDMDIDGYETKKSTKKSKYFSDDNDLDDNDDDDADSSAAEDEEQQQELGGGAKDDGSGGPLTRLVIRAERLPSMAPKGPNQTWTCEEPECGYVVRAADEEDGQNLISAHYAEHEKEARDEAEEAALKRVNLAKMEAGRNMPINHLLEKIRTMGEKSERRNEVKVNGQPLPQPIKRTLLI
ncbi:hypothetical protein SLS62_000737 [Diatrype stigma]|uniref:Uncharacterized protein n=1 Tax=Diatrype stigma TaxID=117547 RepID=A0AAN9YSC5_9PEZI